VVAAGGDHLPCLDGCVHGGHAAGLHLLLAGLAAQRGIGLEGGQGRAVQADHTGTGGHGLRLLLGTLGALVAAALIVVQGVEYVTDGGVLGQSQLRSEGGEVLVRDLHGASFGYLPSRSAGGLGGGGVRPALEAETRCYR
jgi:hypothetical protein